MDTLFLYNTKTLKSQINTKIFAGDNHITKINVQLPDNIGGYPKRECEFNLRAIIPEGNMSYMINPSQPYFYITNDITEKAQTVKLMMIITHEGNVIGRTNTVDLQVREPAEAPDPPLTPRSEFDTVIAEQRETIQEQSQTISSQDETISQQTEQITELSGEVTELTNENTRLENLTDTQRETIQNMIDNPPQPNLYTPPVVTPSGSVQQINPPTGYDGLSSVTVAPVITPKIRLQNKLVETTSNTQLIEADEGYDGLSSVSVTGTSYMNIDLQKWVSPSPNDEPFEMIFETTVRSYVAYNQTKMIKATILTATSIETYAFYSCTGLQSVVFPASLISIGASAFSYCTSLTELTLPGSLTSISNYAFQNCTSLMELTLPGSLTSISTYAFQNCTSLMELTLPGSLTSIGTNAFQGCTRLTELTLPGSLTSIGTNAFDKCTRLTELTLAQGFNCNGLNVSASTRFTAETIVACLEALADRTGQTAYTITFGSTNLNKLTAEQRAIATNKNWNLA